MIDSDEYRGLEAKRCWLQMQIAELQDELAAVESRIEELEAAGADE